MCFCIRSGLTWWPSKSSMSSGKVWRKPLPGCRLSRRGLSKTITPKDPDQRWRSGSKKQRWELPWALTYWGHGLIEIEPSQFLILISQKLLWPRDIQTHQFTISICCKENELLRAWRPCKDGQGVGGFWSSASKRRWRDEESDSFETQIYQSTLGGYVNLHHSLSQVQALSISSSYV